MSNERKLSDAFINAGVSPKLRGAYYQEEANDRGLALVQAKAGDTTLYWLLEPKNHHKVISAKFFTYGGQKSVAVAETYCQLATDKNFDDALLIGAGDVERELRDERDTPSAPEELFALIDIVKTELVKQRDDALAVAQAAAAAKKDIPDTKKPTDDWLKLSKAEQFKKIETALDGSVRDFLASDGGAIEVIDIEDGVLVRVEFQGACGSCAGSMSSTLFGVENMLQREVYPGLRVQPTNTLF